MKLREYNVRLLFVFTVCVCHFFISPFSDELENVTHFLNFKSLMNVAIPLLFSGVVLLFLSKKYLSLSSQLTIFFLYVLFVEKICLGSMKISNVESYAAFSVLYLSVFVLVTTFSGKTGEKIARSMHAVLFMTIWFILSALLVYSFKFDTVVTRDVFYAIGQTNLSEVQEFLFSQVGGLWLVLFVLLNGFAGCLLAWKGRERPTEMSGQVLCVLVVLALSIVIICSWEQRNYRLVKFVLAASEDYENELLLFKQTLEKRTVNPIKATKSETGEVYLVVIGESHNKKHMGLYGYFRDTTPGLDKLNEKGNLLVFDNAFSNHTHTTNVLSLALTEANQYNGKQFYNAASVVGTLKSAGIETYWVSNQVLFGPWDNLVSVMAHEADHLIGLNRGVGKNVSTQKYDGNILLEVEKIIESPGEGTKIIFVHLIGSHWDYCRRFPEEYKIYTEPIKKGVFGNFLTGKKDISTYVNCYDNSVVYNDYVLSSLIHSLKQKGKVSGLVYVADHSEDVFANKGHDKPRFTFAMVQIPFFGWFSEKYQQRYSDRYAVFADSTGKIFSNDLLYDTLLGIFNVKTNVYSPIYDLTSDRYALDKREASFYYQEKKYLAEGNYYYYLSKNEEELANSGQKDKVIPHRVNSVGKLADIWQSGYRSFEMDVHVRSGEKRYLEAGHDYSAMSGKSVKYLFETIDYAEIQKVWFDIKNVSSENYRDLLQALVRLDSQYGIKEKVILEFTVTDRFVLSFSREGYHTSYYLPTKKIATLLKQKNKPLMREFALEIAGFVEKLDLSALSFDKKLYPFVVKYLQPLLTDNIVYHTWDLSIGLHDKKLIKKLRKTDYYQNKKVKTILLPYKSTFDL
jgi:heptose-I-phosphate ethanolaminephosphotransferase